MSDHKHQNLKRRKLLKQAAISGGVLGTSQLMPEKWLKPVINSVMLPAHGQTTDDTGLLGNGTVTTTQAPAEKFYLEESNGASVRSCVEQANGKSPMLKSLADTLISTAQADSSVYIKRYFLEHLGGTLYKFVYLETGGSDGFILWKNYIEGNLNIGENTTLSRFGCYGEPGSTQVNLLSVAPGNNAVLEIDGGCGGQHTLQTNPGASAPQNVACDDIGPS